MPQLGETVTEGTVTRWLKKIGDPVAQDEVLFEVSTDKVDTEVPSSAAGYLTEILVPEGETVDVGVVLAVLSATPTQSMADTTSALITPREVESFEEESSLVAAMESISFPEPAVVPPSVPFIEPALEVPIGSTTQDEVVLSDTLPPETSIDPSSLESTLEPMESDQMPSDRQSSSLGGSLHRLLSPVVRRLVAENGLDIKEVSATGAGGRVTRSDVLNYLDSRAVGSQANPLIDMPQTAPSYPAPASERQVLPSRPQVASVFSAPPVSAPLARAEVSASVTSEREERIPFTNIRRRTAEHMVRSKATSAHTLAAIEVDFEAVEKIRTALRDSFKAEEGFGLTYLPFVARATIEALRTYPHLNSSVGEDELIVHKDLNLSIAVDLGLEGLIAPVIHQADTKRLKGLAREIRDLADRARSKRLSADDIAGGTFTITNPGPYGTFLTVPIINQPQVAILSTDGIKRKPVVVKLSDGGESIAIHSVGMLALSFDHRVIDGAYAASFLARMKEIIETWNWAQEF